MGEPASAPAPARPVVRKNLVYVVGRALADLAALSLCWPRVRGRGNVPPRGAVLLVANHQSFLDIPLLAFAVRRHVCFVGRATLAETSWLRHLMRASGSVFLRRGATPGRATGDKAGIDEVLAHLAAGDCVAIFPEGTRTPDGRLQEFQAGAALIARRSGATIVPVAIDGSFRAWPRTHKLPRCARVDVTLGQPIAPGPGGHDREVLERVRAEIAARLGAEPRNDFAARLGAEPRGRG